MNFHYCKDCSYYTIQLFHFKRHLQSQTHKKKSDIIFDNIINYDTYKRKLYSCNNCKKIYASNRSLQNHKIKCSKNIEMEKIINEIKKNIQTGICEIKKDVQGELSEIKKDV